MPTKNVNLLDVISIFDSEQDCLDYLEKLRWPTGVECPRCGSESLSTVKKRRIWDCNSCRYQFSVKSNTIFHDSHLPLQKWFLATYLMIESRKGISANQIRRMLRVAPKTAWHLCHRIRYAMGSGVEPKLTGTVEVDETFIGGKRIGVGSGSREGKTAVIGAVQRNGEIRLDIITDRGRKTLHKFIHGHTDAEAIYTDDFSAYWGIADADTIHRTVNHSVNEWVNGNVHTNTVEGVWSLLKRSIIGAYHKVSAKHLGAYLDELEHRFNNRSNPYLFRDTMRKLITADKLEYKQLTA